MKNTIVVKAQIYDGSAIASEIILEPACLHDSVWAFIQNVEDETILSVLSRLISHDWSKMYQTEIYFIFDDIEYDTYRLEITKDESNKARQIVEEQVNSIGYKIYCDILCLVVQHKKFKFQNFTHY